MIELSEHELLNEKRIDKILEIESTKSSQIICIIIQNLW